MLDITNVSNVTNEIQLRMQAYKIEN